jgi:HK97 family phage portal protein
MLAQLFAPDARAITQQATTWGTWPGDGMGTTWAGIPVDAASAPQLLAVYGSVTLISDEISTLPIDVEDTARPLWLDEPTPDLNRIQWLGQILWSILLDGNTYLNVMRSGGREAFAFVPLDPTKVKPWRDKGRKRFMVNGQITDMEILHIPGRMLPGADVGLSPVEYARQSIGLGMAAQEFGAKFFDGEGNMPGVIEFPGKATPTPLEVAKFWQRKRNRRNRGMPGVLEGGARWRVTGVTNEQAEFLATRNFTAAEIAGQMFLLDPSDLGIAVDGTSLTYANLAQRDTRRIQVALMPWIRRLELALSTYVPRRGRIQFNVDARLRGSTKESYETLAIAVNGGFMTVNEAREILGLPPIDTPGEVPNDDAA